jgi:hypothetical protein
MMMTYEMHMFYQASLKLGEETFICMYMNSYMYICIHTRIHTITFILHVLK